MVIVSLEIIARRRSYLLCSILKKFSAINQQILQNVNQSWQTLANPSNTVDYSSHLLSATLPISIQHFLKYSESIKKESSALGSNVIGNGSTGNGLNSNLSNINSAMSSANLNLSGMDVNGLNVGNGFNLKSDLLGGLKNGISPNLNLALNQVNNIAMQSHHQLSQAHHNHHSLNTTTSASSNSASTNNTSNGVSNHAAEIIDSVATTTTTTVTNGKKKKKKAPKEKKPRPKPGEIRETKALDGSTLYCCPEWYSII